MNVSLNNHPVWDEFDKVLTQIDVKALAMEHLAACNYKVNGYWDEDEFYEEIAFVSPLRVELANSSVGKTQIDHHSHRWVRLQFSLKLDTSASEAEQPSDDEEIGELTLVLDSAWRIVDENWVIDVQSPFVTAKKAQNG
ncbi:MAG: hypothetical protein O7E52_18435 [Candidatus Poribacteria bacterium]|nr:hypothetical protein [Candidatus Poribacteria bacterium]